MKCTFCQAKPNRLLVLTVCAALLMSLLSGCCQEKTNIGTETSGRASEAESMAAEATVEETELPTEPPTTPPDGDPDDVTCQGSYTVEASAVQAAADTVVASIGESQLTVGQLQVYYWMEVAAYRQAEHEIAPNFDRPLDTQLCEIDETAVTWQQYFLQLALNSWHSQQALTLQGEDEGLPTEEAFNPSERNHQIYLSDIPAVKYLYGYYSYFVPNDMYQEYLDNIPAMLEELATANGFASVADLAKDIAGSGADAEDLESYTHLYNWAYMYFSSLCYYIEPTAEEVEAYYAENETAYQASGITRDSGKYVDLRHVLLIPEGASVAADGTVSCSEDAWNACLASAQELLDGWKEGNATYATFAELANQNSADAGSSINGGLYSSLHKGQLTGELDKWCFDDARQDGDTDIIRTACGYHIVYFSGSKEIWYAQAEEDLIAQKASELISGAKEKYPMEIDYSAIKLGLAESTAPVTAAEDLLYPDVAHERYPTVPLYLQQEYLGTMYGNYSIVSNGCGITTMAMLASYMTDTELTPPEMCERYASYSLKNGTNSVLYDVAPAEMGFFLEGKTYEWREAREALSEGHIVISLQHKGFWTRGGHFLVLQEMTEDGKVVVRDSNLYNYGKLHGHKSDCFGWDTISPAGACYWIYQYKVTRIPTCVRCGDPEGGEVPTAMFAEDYYCAKCNTAMQRRENYITLCNGAN